jgi:hypothetical protein
VATPPAETRPLGGRASSPMKSTSRFGDYTCRVPHTSRWLQLGQRSIPRSRTRPPQVPAGARQSPQDEVRNALLAAGIPADPRQDRKRQDRPVTPEVAGSSPVAPAQCMPCKRASCVAFSGSKTRTSGSKRAARHDLTLKRRQARVSCAGTPATALANSSAVVTVPSIGSVTSSANRCVSSVKVAQQSASTITE